MLDRKDCKIMSVSQDGKYWFDKKVIAQFEDGGGLVVDNAVSLEEFKARKDGFKVVRYKYVIDLHLGSLVRWVNSKDFDNSPLFVARNNMFSLSHPKNVWGLDLEDIRKLIIKGKMEVVTDMKLKFELV